MKGASKGMQREVNWMKREVKRNCFDEKGNRRGTGASP
jgi:hypothetical protein